MNTRIIVTARTADFTARAGDNICRGTTPVEAIGNLVRNYGSHLGISVEMPSDADIERALAARASATPRPEARS